MLTSKVTAPQNNIEELKELKAKHDTTVNEATRKHGQYEKDIQGLRQQNDDTEGIRTFYYYYKLSFIFISR